MSDFPRYSLQPSPSAHPVPLSLAAPPSKSVGMASQGLAPLSHVLAVSVDRTARCSAKAFRRCQPLGAPLWPWDRQGATRDARPIRGKGSGLLGTPY
eukprot:8728753-Pyramimonas_sp.AAC.1